VGGWKVRATEALYTKDHRAGVLQWAYTGLAVTGARISSLLCLLVTETGRDNWHGRRIPLPPTFKAQRITFGEANPGAETVSR